MRCWTYNDVYNKCCVYINFNLTTGFCEIQLKILNVSNLKIPILWFTSFFSNILLPSLLNVEHFISVVQKSFELWICIQQVYTV